LARERPRLIVVGGVGSLLDESGAPVLDRVPKERRPEHLGQKGALDLYRTVSDVQWTYVSPPGRIAPGERTGAYRVGGDELLRNDVGESGISMEDYAVAVLDEVKAARYIGRRFTVAY
jgi:putative NADH-flavin reductase